MAATFDHVRQMALPLPGVTEGRCYDTPALYIGRKLMVRLWEDGETLVAKVDPAERTRMLEDFPDLFFLTDHYRNYPCVLVNLPAIQQDKLRAVIDGAWRMVASKRQITLRDAARSEDP